MKHQGMFKSHRVCPECEGHFTVDPKTKKRQAAFIVVALIALVLTFLLKTQGTKWLFPALVIYALFVGLLIWGNRLVYFVPVKRE
ncbi:MAG TPA: hypothetical protein VJ984_15375 [Xanthomonadales bacterium]|nr:hypothetical protein [Xanthomonadales bacterium]